MEANKTIFSEGVRPNLNSKDCQLKYHWALECSYKALSDTQALNWTIKTQWLTSSEWGYSLAAVLKSMVREPNIYICTLTVHIMMPW